MTVRLDSRNNLTLGAVRRVAWEGEPVELTPAARERMDASHAAFERLVRARAAADPGALIYGVTTAPGDGAAVPLGPDAEVRRPTRLWTAVSFGEPLPPRVVRGIVLARLANFLDGHAAVRATVADAVAALLGAPSLPTVPAQGNGGAGEVLALGHLFYGLSERHDLTAKERMALINGSPCAAALVADVALAAAGRRALAEQVFALAVDVIGAPLEAYAPELGELWGDEHETAALAVLRSLAADGGGQRDRHQAAVSFRILPRVLGQARRAQAAAEQAAAVSLRSVTDNPVFLPPEPDHPERPLGDVLSNGGYHNAWAPAAMDGVSFAWADLCQLAQRQTDKLFQHPASAGLLVPDEFTSKAAHMVQTAWADEARGLARPSLLSIGGFGQNDVPSMAFVAWRTADAIGRCLDASLAVLAAMCSQALHAAGRPAPARLAPLVAAVRAVFPPVTEVRRQGRELEALARWMASQVLPARDGLRADT